MILSEDKKFSELVLEERDKGNVVFLCIDSIMCAPVKEIIKQPTDGLLWDLNRDEATALTFMDKEGMLHWVNNFAVALVIRELKKEVAQLEGAWENAGHRCPQCGAGNPKVAQLEAVKEAACHGQSPRKL